MNKKEAYEAMNQGHNISSARYHGSDEYCYMDSRGQFMYTNDNKRSSNYIISAMDDTYEPFYIVDNEGNKIEAKAQLKTYNIKDYK